jgi:hypothetical protein
MSTNKQRFLMETAAAELKIKTTPLLTRTLAASYSINNLVSDLHMHSPNTIVGGGANRTACIAVYG